MDGLFQRLAGASRATVERVHGDAITVYPTEREGPNGGRSVSDLTAYEVVGCFFENTLTETDALSQPLTGNGRMMHSAPAVSVSIKIPEGQNFAAGFFISRKRDRAAFEVTSYKPDGLGGVLAAVSRIKAIPGDVTC